jgi:Protein of unknown function (DUF4241)
MAFIFLSCRDNSGNNNAGLPMEALDTIRLAPANITTKPVLFETAFIKGTKEKINSATLSLYGITIGKIKISSGRIIACDPLHVDEYGKPFTQLFPTGEFPVQLAITHLDGDESIAFARISFSDEPVERWQFALQAGQPARNVGDEDIQGFAADAGIGIFVDEEASKKLDRNRLTDTDTEMYQEMKKHQHKNWRYAMYNFGTHNLAAFTTGLGDGYFASYIGLDANGKPCRLVTDFGLFDWKKVFKK